MVMPEIYAGGMFCAVPPWLLLLIVMPVMAEFVLVPLELSEKAFAPALIEALLSWLNE